MNLTDAGLREQAEEWCGKNLSIWSEWTIDELMGAFIAVRGMARAEQLERDAKIAESLFPRGGAHTYASENADRYIALEDAAQEIAAAICAQGGE